MPVEFLEGITPVARTAGSSAATGEGQACKLSWLMTLTLLLYRVCRQLQHYHGTYPYCGLGTVVGDSKDGPPKQSHMWGSQPYYLPTDYDLQAL